MAIETRDRYFGDGISNYGEAEPIAAFNQHRRHLRQQRLNDALGGGQDSKFTIAQIADRFETIALAVQKADDQAFGDNADFCATHNITRA